MQTMIETKDHTFAYPAEEGEEPRAALKDVNVSIERGSFVVVLGHNGSGKSTLAKHMNAVLLPSGGAVYVEGMDTRDEACLLEIRRRVGMVFQNPGMSFNPIRKIGAQFLEALKNHGKIDESQATKQILDMFTRLGLREGKRILNSYPFELSGGMNQRVGICISMLQHPSLLLADEPTSALDVIVQKQVVEEMLLLRQEYHTAMIIVTHNIGVVGKMADKVLVLKNGKVMEYGDTRQVLDDPQDPFTKELMNSVPRLNRGKLESICTG